MFSSGLHTLGEAPNESELAGYLEAYFGENEPQRREGREGEEEERIRGLLMETTDELANWQASCRLCRSHQDTCIRLVALDSALVDPRRCLPPELGNFVESAIRAEGSVQRVEDRSMAWRGCLQGHLSPCSMILDDVICHEG